MSIIDEILAAGWYTDRRGREWKKCPPNCCLNGGWVSLAAMFVATQRTEWHPFEDEMRLLIERDMHRDECPGLTVCQEHPVPFVEKHVHHGEESFAVIDTTRPGGSFGAIVDAFSTHAEAMDAARELAVKS